MALIEYTPPASWTDKGLDWNAIDTGKLDYFAAIREALLERFVFCKLTPPNDLLQAALYRPLNANVFTAARDSIRSLAPYFINMSREHDDGICYTWTYGELLTMPDCNIAEAPGPGSMLEQYEVYFQRLRNAINQLTHTREVEITEIPSTQIDSDTIGTPHYSIVIAESAGLERGGFLCAEGSADDALELIAGGRIIYTDHDPEVDGATHGYGGALGAIPAGTSFEVLLWDTAYVRIKWEGRLYLSSEYPRRVDFKFHP